MEQQTIKTPKNTAALQPKAAGAVAKKKGGTVVSYLNDETFKSQLAAALPKFLDTDRFVRSALTEFRLNPALAECSVPSVLGYFMQAAACGLGCVLIRGSCAAEGITDGRNGFLIDETPEAMAQLLKRVCPDLPRLHEIGQHAMDEIYLSWQSAIAAAYDRYGAILDLKRSGALPPKRKLPTDYLVALASRSMEERVRRRRIRQELLSDFKETAQGMMENIQEAQKNAEQRWAKVAEDIQRELEALRRE